MKKTIAEAILVAAVLMLAAFEARAQASQYSATTGDVVLSGAGTQFTIQQPAANAKLVQLSSAVVYCSVACNVTQTQNGTAATAIAGTANPLLPFGRAASATVWTASNAGAGTPAGGVLHLAAGERVTLDLSAVAMGNTGTGTNYTIAISSITGTANIALFWSEK